MTRVLFLLALALACGTDRVAAECAAIPDECCPHADVQAIGAQVWCSCCTAIASGVYVAHQGAGHCRDFAAKWIEVCP